MCLYVSTAQFSEKARRRRYYTLDVGGRPPGIAKFEQMTSPENTTLTGHAYR